MCELEFFDELLIDDVELFTALLRRLLANTVDEADVVADDEATVVDKLDKDELELRVEVFGILFTKGLRL